MCPAVNHSGGGNFITIIGGKFKEKSEEGVAGATLRQYKVKDRSTGAETTGEKWELTYDAWKGTIVEIAFEDTKFGKVINLKFDDVVVQISKQSRYFSSLLEKLPNVDLKKELTITPYSFEAEGKTRTGVTIYQGEGKDNKLKGYFYDGKNSLHGCPDGDGVDWGDEDECKMFFMQRDKFLINYIQENVIDKMEKVVEPKAETPKGVELTGELDEDGIPVIEFEPPANDIKLEDVPF